MPLSATPELHPQPQVIAVYESAVCFLLYDFLSYFVILMYIYIRFGFQVTMTPR